MIGKFDSGTIQDPVKLKRKRIDFYEKADFV